MVDKLQMAHEWAMKSIDAGYVCETDMLVKEAWCYADAMQAEADRRNIGEDWQPDWSEAPDKAKEWRMFGDGSCMYYDKYGRVLEAAPSFNYQGDWRKSLRKRP